MHELKPLLHILEHAKKSGRSLLIAAEDVDQEVLSTLLHNLEKSELTCCAMNFPGEANTELLEDLAAFTNSTLISNTKDLKNSGPETLGTCRRVSIGEVKSNFLGGEGNVSTRTQQLEEQILLSEMNEEKEVLRERISRLSGKMAVIEIGVGGGSLAMGERRDRIVDALNSVKSSFEKGFLPGGATSLFYAARKLSKIRNNDETDIGVRMLQEAMKLPLERISENSEAGVVVTDILWEEPDEEVGLNAMTGQIVNLVDEGIIDSTHVVINALRNAVSLAQLAISTSCVVARPKRYEPSKLNKYPKQPF